VTSDDRPCFNVGPGFVATERNQIVVKDFGRDVSEGAPPEAIGATIAWLVSSAEGDAYRAETVNGQELARELGFLPSAATV
jgi:NAD(P)-dependent dehydrogenase (short-subunit alcohol dehydrogenase family)